MEKQTKIRIGKDLWEKPIKPIKGDRFHTSISGNAEGSGGRAKGQRAVVQSNKIK
jgi:hypothetical protein